MNRERAVRLSTRQKIPAAQHLWFPDSREREDKERSAEALARFTREAIGEHVRLWPPDDVSVYGINHVAMAADVVRRIIAAHTHLSGRAAAAPRGAGQCRLAELVALHAGARSQVSPL